MKNFVSFRRPRGHQRAVAFSAGLSRELNLRGYSRMACAQQSATQLVFRPTDDNTRGTSALQTDGGTSAGVVLHLHSEAIAESEVPSGRYPVEIIGSAIYVNLQNKS